MIAHEEGDLVFTCSLWRNDPVDLLQAERRGHAVLRIDADDLVHLRSMQIDREVYLRLLKMSVGGARQTIFLVLQKPLFDGKRDA